MSIDTDNKLAKSLLASRRITALCLFISILFAWYVGFRPPSSWAATLQAVSVTDGFHRRFAVGTLLRPLAIATDYNYWLFAVFCFAVLAALIGTMVRVALRSESSLQRVLIVAFFLLPTGGFSFHIVGYQDQTLYLILFASIWLLNRDRHVLAAILMCLSPLVHEAAILTVIPLFGIFALRRATLRTAIVLTLAPALVNVVILLLPPTDASAIETLSAALRNSNFKFRAEALDLFARTQADSWKLYKIRGVSIHIKPIVALCLIAFSALFWINRSFWTVIPKLKPILSFAALAAAIAMPSLLVYGGWDHNRWIMFILCNFFLVAWLLLEERREVTPNTSLILIVTLFALSHVNLTFFAPELPRKLEYNEIEFMFRELREGVFFVTPEI